MLKIRLQGNKKELRRMMKLLRKNLRKIRKCRCRFKDENGNMVENQCWQ